MPHAGDLTPKEAWDLLADEGAVLVDVRTRPEWMFVGTPDLSGVSGEPVLIEWQVFPAMGVAPDFGEALEAELSRRGAGKEVPLVFLCRSGVRSSAAASLMTQHGHSRAYNITGGFEGGHDAEGHRGTREGWKADGLPWRQP